MTRRIKVTIYTKTGNKISYYPSDGWDESQARNWWLRAVEDPSSAVRFGRFIMPAANIDYVEVLP